MCRFEDEESETYESLLKLSDCLARKNIHENVWLNLKLGYLALVLRFSQAVEEHKEIGSNIRDEPEKLNPKPDSNRTEPTSFCLQLLTVATHGEIISTWLPRSKHGEVEQTVEPTYSCEAHSCNTYSCNAYASLAHIRLPQAMPVQFSLNSCNPSSCHTSSSNVQSCPTCLRNAY